MIRINLLGQARPKAAKQAVPLEATLQIVLFVAAVAVAGVILSVVYFSQKRDLDATNKRIAALRAEKASLEQIKQDVDRFESEKNVLQQRIDVIETLQKNRSGAQDLLQMVANTVVRVDQLWLTEMNRTSDSLSIKGEAGSINAVANFITELKRSGYFDKIEIKDAKEDDLETGVETYGFEMTVAIAAPTTSSGQAKTQPAGAPQAPPTPAKGRS
ncbi:MAG TPA: PilN domain-containing protein [Candidatus Acidoferrales bacterium]|nr:PilN domain-containing protein [Candidatus Acidoferrales bacterium]